MQFRQGDVFVEKIDLLPGNLEKQENKDKIILAWGEATGHHHAITCDNSESFVDCDGNLFLLLSEEKILTHQEHAPITLPPGNYKVKIQKEYEPEAIRNVLD